MFTRSSEKRIAIVGHDDDHAFVESLCTVLLKRGLSARRLSATALRVAARSPDLTLLVGNAAVDGGAKVIDEIGTGRGPFAIVAPSGALAARIEARRRGVAIVPKKAIPAEVADEVERLLAGGPELPLGTPVARVLSNVASEVSVRLGTSDAPSLRIKAGEEARAREITQQFVTALAAISESSPGLISAGGSPPPATVDGLDWDDDPQTLPRKNTHTKSDRAPSKRETLPGISRFPSAAALLDEAPQTAPDGIERSSLGAGLVQEGTEELNLDDLAQMQADAEADAEAFDPTADAETFDPDVVTDQVKPKEILATGPEAEGEDASEYDPDPSSLDELLPPDPATVPRAAPLPSDLKVPKEERGSEPPVYPALKPPPSPPIRDVRASLPDILAQPKRLDGPLSEPAGAHDAVAPSVDPAAEDAPERVSVQAARPAAAASAVTGGAHRAVHAPPKSGVVRFLGAFVAVIFFGVLALGALFAFEEGYFDQNPIVDSETDPNGSSGADGLSGNTGDAPVGHDPTPDGPDEPRDPDPPIADGTDPPPVADPVPVAPDPIPIPIDPEEARAIADGLVREGETHERFQRWPEARAVFERAVAVHDPHPRAHAGLARALVELGNPRTALPHAERAATLRRRRADYQVLLGDVRLASGDRGGARRAWLRAVDIDPNHEDAQERLTGG